MKTIDKLKRAHKKQTTDEQKRKFHKKVYLFTFSQMGGKSKKMEIKGSKLLVFFISSLFHFLSFSFPKKKYSPFL